MSETAALASLFFSAFVSATLLPGGSEVLLALWVRQDLYSPWGLWAAATAGNVAGSAVTFAMGRWASRRWGRAFLDDPRRARALQRLRRWGVWSLLMAWLPVVGDPLCLVAGWLRMAWWPALAAIAVGKAGRYALLVWGAGLV